jgi:hypothetical protein
MANVFTSPADPVNAALRRIGYKLRVGNLYDGSAASNQVLDIYGQTRDQLLRSGNWGFAQRTINGVITTGATTPWLYAYTYPTDCLRVRALFPLGYDTNNPVRARYLVASSGVSTKYILTNLASAVIVYTAQITFLNPWDNLFTEAFILALAKRLSPILSSLEVEKVMAEEEKATAPFAEAIIG